MTEIDGGSWIMAGQNPYETVSQLVAAINAGDVDKALKLYHPEATFVSEPGKSANGKTAIREMLNGFMALKPTITIENYETVEAGDVAFQCTKWTLNGTKLDGSSLRMNGKGIVVLRRQQDGEWFIAVENPWGTDIVQ